jgi:DNA-binding transcriptional LysR family regulator
MDRLEAMPILLAVVEAGSLSAAARRYSIPLATVSRKLSDLETHLGTRLLNRSSRRVSLADAGRLTNVPPRSTVESGGGGCPGNLG